MPSKPFGLVYDHRVRLDECIFGADSEKKPVLMEPGLNQPVCVCVCVYVCVSHLTVEQPVKSMNEYTGSIFHFFIWSPHSGHVVFVSGQKQ